MATPVPLHMQSGCVGVKVHGCDQTFYLSSPTSKQLTGTCIVSNIHVHVVIYLYKPVCDPSYTCTCMCIYNVPVHVT